MNSAVCNCSYTKEEKEDQQEGVHCEKNNFETGKGDLRVKLSEIVEIILGVKEGEVERRINDESEKDRQVEG